MGFSRQEYWSGVPLPSPLCTTAHAKYKKSEGSADCPANSTNGLKSLCLTQSTAAKANPWPYWTLLVGVSNLWDLMPDDLRWRWYNSNRNKMHNMYNVLESSWNHPSTLVCGKLVFHETDPRCQKDWGPLLLDTSGWNREFLNDSGEHSWVSFPVWLSFEYLERIPFYSHGYAR